MPTTKPDLLISSSTWGPAVNVWLGNGNGTFQVQNTITLTGSTPSAIVVGDVNGDGRPDLIVNTPF